MRPTHDDFWKLCAIAKGIDAVAEEDQGIDRVMNPIIDGPSLVYVAEQRCLGLLLQMPQPKTMTDLLRLMQSVYVDAFTIGTLYQKDKDS